MIEPSTDLPEGLSGFRLVGEVTAADYEAIVIPSVEAAIRDHGRIRLVVEIGPDFDGFAPGAAWDDMRFGMTHLSAWERAALVTDHPVIGPTARAFAAIIPGVRVFPAAERDVAVEWAASDA
jgi:hypothetical protein